MQWVPPFLIAGRAHLLSRAIKTYFFRVMARTGKNFSGIPRGLYRRGQCAKMGAVRDKTLRKRLKTYIIIYYIMSPPVRLGTKTGTRWWFCMVLMFVSPVRYIRRATCTRPAAQTAALRLLYHDAATRPQQNRTCCGFAWFNVLKALCVSTGACATHTPGRACGGFEVIIPYF